MIQETYGSPAGTCRAGAVALHGCEERQDGSRHHDEQELAQVVRADAIAHRLCTVPGIGPITAITFEAVVDHVARFASAKEMRASVGLVPRR